MTHPYYLIAPRYIRTSAGARVLYRLCDLINKSGHSAFIFLRPHGNHALSASPMDVAPFLTPKTIRYHFDNGLTPIVIYPEISSVAPLDAPVRVRYLLNYDNLLCQNDPLGHDDYLIGYSQRITDLITVNKPRSTIFLPVSDPVFFCPPKVAARRGAVFYAGKYKNHFGGKTFPITDGLPEITRDRPDSQTPEDIRAMFQQSELFYCYEDSSLALEAILCGCPTVFLPNAHFSAPLGQKELNGLGYAWGTDPADIAHAQNTVAAARERYFELLAASREQVAHMITATQGLAATKPYTRCFAQSQLRSPGFAQRALDTGAFLRDLIDDRGVGWVLHTLWKRVSAGRLRLFDR